MSDYNFGLNLVTLLNSLAILDDHEIDSNQFEVEVVEENGQEDFATVEIQSLAKDAADTITALQQKLAALAAENAVMKSAIAGYAKVKQDFDDFDGDRRGIAESLCEAEDALVSGIKTPATDAYLNSVRAESWADALIMVKSAIFTDSLDHIDFIFNGKIEQLRSGTHDTADKAG